MERSAITPGRSKFHGVGKWVSSCTKLAFIFFSVFQSAPMFSCLILWIIMKRCFYLQLVVAVGPVHLQCVRDWIKQLPSGTHLICIEQPLDVIKNEHTLMIGVGTDPDDGWFLFRFTRQLSECSLSILVPCCGFILSCSGA